MKTHLKENKILLAVFFITLIHSQSLVLAGNPEEEHGVIYADNCEACKILAAELDDRLKQTGKSHDVIETGYSLDDVKPKKRVEYRKSELRLEESRENVCDQVLQYNIHKERKDSTRFAKGMSQTFQTLHGLVNKGVKVDLGIPYELWDNPSAEITKLKTQCETLLEEYEDEISTWYFEKQGEVPLVDYLCRDIVLKGKNTKCLSETLQVEEKKDEAEPKPKKKKKKNKEKKDKNSKGEEEAKMEEVTVPKEEL